LLGLVYVSLIPYSWMSYQRQARQDRERAGAEVVNLRAVDSGSPPAE
jgi:CDP-diacylglycerol--serine O-phosphatidyltransferase